MTSTSPPRITIRVVRRDEIVVDPFADEVLRLRADPHSGVKRFWWRRPGHPWTLVERPGLLPPTVVAAHLPSPLRLVVFSDCRVQDLHPAAGGSLGLNVLYVGERDDLDFQNSDPVTFQPARIPLGSYTRLDLAGAYDVLRGRPGWPGLAVTLRIENLWDDDYEEVRHFPARGRTIFVAARLSVGL